MTRIHSDLSYKGTSNNPVLKNLEIIKSTIYEAKPVRKSNGFVERLHKTLLDEHFRVQGRKKWYESTEEMQKDLDSYFHSYNNKRAHQGRNMKDRTPYKAFLDGIPKGDKTEAKKKVKKAA